VSRADVPSVSISFPPNPVNHVRICGRNRFWYPYPQFFETCRKSLNKNFVFSLSPHRKSRDVKSGGRGGHKQHCSRLAPIHDSMMTGRIYKQLYTSGTPSGGLNDNLKTRRNFWNVRDQVVIYSSEVITAGFCITKLGTPCIFFIRQPISYIQCNLADFDSV
jgi:hypothetical protein